MLGTSKSRPLGATAARLVLAGAAALPGLALAQNMMDHTPSAQHQVAVRDAATGQLRAATVEEAQALAAAVRTPGSPSTAMSKSHASGARGARLTDEFQSYSIVMRQADGKLAAMCVHSREEVDAALKAAASKSQSAPTE